MSSVESSEREALLDRVRAIVDERGITSLALDDFSQALSMPLERLREFFDSKEDLVLALFARSRIAQRRAFAAIDADAKASRIERARAVWQFFVDSESDSRLMFEAFAMGLRDPQYLAFLHGVDDWIALSEAALVRAGYPRERALAMATLALAVHRGAMMDLCATGERERVDAAMELWLRAADEELDV